MYKLIRKLLDYGFQTVFSLVFAAVLVLFVHTSPIIAGISSALGFVLLSWVLEILLHRTQKDISQQYLDTTYNGRLFSFADRIRVSFSISDLITALKDDLEEKCDFAILWIDTQKQEIIYNTAGRKTSSPEKLKMLLKLKDLPNGVHYLDDEDRQMSYYSLAACVILKGKNHLLCLFSKHLKSYDESMFPIIQEEYISYLTRVITIEEMFALSAISKEWELLAQTQKSFLPTKLPRIPSADFNVYFKPLVNVSGDYYDLIPIDEHKTLLVLGDVSGKGLSAALIMGIIISTIKISENKENLELIARNVDRAIKDMGFEAKFTALFLGLLDTAEKTLRYINAGMPEPIIVSPGKGLKTLEPNCQLLGIIDLDDFHADTVKIYDGNIIIIGSDGITEVADANGQLLGDSDLFQQTLVGIQQNVEKISAKSTTDVIINLVSGYHPEGALRDDITLMVAHLEEAV